ncbi:DUF3515 family protein [Microbacterium sp. C7(2022)]|uniref:DUF3515 family protein n=1 Tax=Microbacterium sp. C7(2022) TaxID=2992759 RepID=UPI00237B6EF4|nr:DUF3515 family protein [Microbacterium sp. C7(2022)]MDE0546871.1 DUF3515 domain-containing protein [Microbacterium sp. C7(2022)]
MVSARRLSALPLLATFGLVIAGCSTTVPMEPAADANDPACAEVMVRLPGTVDGQDRLWTDAQATAAWGESGASAVLLTCGVTPPGPTTLPCQSVNSVDWIIDDSDAPRYRVTTFGRTPAVEIYLDNEVVSSASVLERLSGPVSLIPVEGVGCLDRPSGEDDAQG